MIVAAIDIGSKNFAFSVEEYDPTQVPATKNLEETYRSGKLLYCEKKDLSNGNVYLNLTLYLNTFRDVWRRTSVILIEKQMRRNTKALCLAQHCMSYFMTLFGPFKILIDFPSQHKTRLLGCPMSDRRKKRDRKRFAEKEALRVLTVRHDPLLDTFNKFKKQDDVADTILMIQAYKLTV
jgi:Poxvirus A22 protein